MEPDNSRFYVDYPYTTKFGTVRCIVTRTTDHHSYARYLVVERGADYCLPVIHDNFRALSWDKEPFTQEISCGLEPAQEIPMVMVEYRW